MVPRSACAARKYDAPSHKKLKEVTIINVFFILIFSKVVHITLVLVLFVLVRELVDWRRHSKRVDLGLVLASLSDTRGLVCSCTFMRRSFGVVVVHNRLELK
jgi:hypothetical protein